MLHRLLLSLAALVTMVAACHPLAVQPPATRSAAAFTPAGGARDQGTAPSAEPQDDPAIAQREFIAAMDRVRRRLPEPPDPPTLKTYVLYDYLLAARLQRDLELQPDAGLDDRIDTFLRSRAAQPVTRGLRGAWLASLATRGRWDLFLTRAAEVTNPTLVCDRLAGRLATGDTGTLAADTLARWSLPQKQPPECEPVFEWLRQQGYLTPALLEARTRAALAADNPRFARETLAELPADRAAPLRLWIELLEGPRPALKLLAADATRPVEAPALEAGFGRLARTEAPVALSLLPALLARPDMTPPLRARLRRLAALGAAYDRDPAALAVFRELPDAAVDEDVREWRVRAALWAGNFRTAIEWIEQMPASLAAQPRWRYWHARAEEAVHGARAAAPLFEEIAGLRDFYGYLAADHLHRDYALNARPSADDPEVQRALAADPGLMRARALFDCNMTDDAQLEWAQALAGAGPAVRLQAAHLAADWGWYAQSIATLAQVGELDDVRLRYPRPYSPAVAAASKLTQLPEDWILAVMRQESLFRSDAVSHAGARGLMQMQPSTAAAVARRWHLPLPKSPEGTYDPDPDVALGAAYLRELLDRYGGQLGPALAAYNAGPIPVARWLPPAPEAADIWIENIPYGETRTYVQRVLEHIVAFAWVRNAPLPHIAGLLPPVEPNAFYAQLGRP